eukprot:TRINITY_DN3809_c0_g1_i1.p1 TRINITY_DN3809_c0_g1~~TRINITY_DN3809_c0_g1_i1.p1  ORF type:complete len:278 (+),score=51.59 TRINITY_DN3809_c0_g1_i1:467-1300(+)
MGDEHAKQHDAILHSYVERVVEARETGKAVESRVVGRGRDFYAKTKTGRFVRIFLTVKQVDRPSGDPRECLLVGTLLLVQKAHSGEVRGSRGSDCRGSAGVVSAEFSHPSGGRPETHLGPLRAVKVTIVAADIFGFDHTAPGRLHGEYQSLLNLALHLATKYRATLRDPVGDRLFICFNTEIPNSTHRAAAGSLIHQLLTAWRTAKSAGGLRVAVAASTGDALVGPSPSTAWCRHSASTSARHCCTPTARRASPTPWWTSRCSRNSSTPLTADRSTS